MAEILPFCKTDAKVALVALGVLAVVALLTNPNERSHVQTIKETVLLKDSAAFRDVNTLPVIRYNNYGLFSTTTFHGMIFSWGYFGQVATTNDIAYFDGSAPADEKKGS